MNACAYGLYAPCKSGNRAFRSHSSFTFPSLPRTNHRYASATTASREGKSTLPPIITRVATWPQAGWKSENEAQAHACIQHMEQVLNRSGINPAPLVSMVVAMIGNGRLNPTPTAFPHSLPAQVQAGLTFLTTSRHASLRECVPCVSGSVHPSVKPCFVNARGSGGCDLR